MPKQLVREKILAQRRQCDHGRCQSLSRAIQDRFLETDAFAGAVCMALYSPVHNEVGTERVAAEALRCGKRLAYPRVEGGGLVFVLTEDPALLSPGYFDVPEPGDGQTVPSGEIDLFIVPGVAFDLDGHRLGYGKGFYDRLLGQASHRAVRIGFSYDFQVVEALPVQPHDQRLSMLITEKRILRFPD